MAKSLGNFEPLSDVVQRHDPQAIRWLFLQTGYRKVMNFTEGSITAAALGLARVKAAYREATPATDGEPVLSPELDERMEAALDDDMNTAAALAVLYDTVSHSVPSRERLAYWLGVLGIEPNDSWLEEPAIALAPDFTERLQRALQEAEFDVGARTIEGTEPNDAIERIVALRSEARRTKDWAASDRLREALARCGIDVKDSKEGTTWSVTAR